MNFINEDIFKNIKMRHILDKSIKITSTLNYLINDWQKDFSYNQFDYNDLISYLYCLLPRNIYIKILNKNISGRLINILGNCKNFKFSIKLLNDNNFYCLSLTDEEENLNKDLINNLQIFLSNKKENLFKNNNIELINSNKWVEFYSERYFLTKCLIDRIQLESSYYLSLIKEMINNGIKYSKKENNISFSNKLKEDKKKIKTLEVNVIHPDFISEFKTYSFNQNNLINLIDKRKQYVYSILPKLNFMIRSIEYSFFKNNKNITPSEIKNEWKENKIKRIIWNELLFNNYGIRKRIKEYKISI